jgi:hypothetical protein
LVKCALLLSVSVVLTSSSSFAQGPPRDAYVRYELLPPQVGSLRVLSDITVAEPGSKSHVEPIGKGADPTEVSAVDLMTGAPLIFRLAPGSIRVELARPVPAGGEARIRVARTERDAASYKRMDDGLMLMFNRSLTSRRGSVTLPAGYELLGATLPVQVLELPDGRISASFMNPYPVGLAAPITIHAGRLRAKAPAPPAVVSAGAPPVPPVADAPPREQPMHQVRVTERAVQDREIVYFLKEPETHAFALYHDYTAAREGERQYVNVVRAGSSVSEPSAKILDTGEMLQTRTLTGADISREKIEIPDRVDPDTQVVLIAFPPVKPGTSLRLRISETYTLVDGQLMWRRSLGRPRNDMVLPAGWYLTTSSIPAVISQDSEGRIRLSFWNPRSDSLDVVVRGRRR